jgi:NAD-dependent deacetylase
MWKGRCPVCGEIADLPKTPLESLPPYCKCGTPLRPHVVQFGEPIDPAILRAAIDSSERAELFLVIGTSGVVSPARDLPLIALARGAKVIEINRDPTPLTPLVTRTILGKASEILPRLWKEFLKRKR